MTKTLILAAAEGGEAHNPLLPAFGELVYGGLAFAVLFGLMAWKVWPAIAKSLDERARNIEGKLEQAERDRAEAAALRERYQRQLDTAQDKADAIVSEARQRGEDTRRDIVARAEEDAAERLRRANEQIRVERDRAVTEVRQDVGRLAVQLAERIIGESMSDATQQRVVDRFVDELSGSPLSPRGTGVVRG